MHSVFLFDLRSMLCILFCDIFFSLKSNILCPVIIKIIFLVFFFQSSDHQTWLTLLGCNLQNLAPQLYPGRLSGGGMPLTPPGLWSSKEQVPYVISAHSPIQLHKDTASAFGVASGFLADISERCPGDASTLSSLPH